MSKTNYKVLKNDILGRYMVAARKIKAGELILSETPVLIGPQVDGPMICFNCCKGIRKAGYIFCPKCNTAILCSPKCTGKLHTEEECNALKSSPVKGEDLAENTPASFPLRCILLRSHKPETWQQILQLEPHMEERRHSPIWRRHQITVEHFLRKHKALSDEDTLNELVQRICGVLDVNTFEVRPPNSNLVVITNPEKQCLRGLYLNAALMAHDCNGNTFLSVDDDFVLTVKASVDIPENSPIYFNYANVLQGSSDRRQHLREGKYFDCFCTRCNDSTEMGSEISSLHCHRCHKGLIRVKDPKDLNSDWECSYCKKMYRRWLIRSIVEEGRRRIEETDPTNMKAMESVLNKLLQTFNNNHHLMVELQQNMIGNYMRLPPTKNNLTQKVRLCENLMNVFSKIEPGISRIKALTLYQLQSAMIDLAHKQYQDKDINISQLITKLAEAESKLKECLAHLLHEPPKSPEGRICHMALSELKMLRTSIGNIQKEVMFAEVDDKAKLKKSRRKVDREKKVSVNTGDHKEVKAEGNVKGEETAEGKAKGRRRNKTKK
ncbi:unnamed protein product [Callosobruchus maculatus]|uniref:SET domain-containing protein n=1 Tax=Callosobruchus maculatus TaxID=64391 RepID=A0A653BHU2_CALMS|nr:unnamed protein product [Callosobruchus maculatus]